jgi:hypothetical protein
MSGDEPRQRIGTPALGQGIRIVHQFDATQCAEQFGPARHPGVTRRRSSTWSKEKRRLCHASSLIDPQAQWEQLRMTSTRMAVPTKDTKTDPIPQPAGKAAEHAYFSDFSVFAMAGTLAFASFASVASSSDNVVASVFTAAFRPSALAASIALVYADIS